MNIPREITTHSQPYWDTDEILLFIGARQAGKTTILRQIQETHRDAGHTTYWLNLEDPEYLQELNKSPKNLFKIFPIDRSSRSVVFIDEVQYLDNPTNVLKYLYDEHKDTVKLIVSGSSAFYIDNTFKDSLVGRKRIFNVQTLSFREFLQFNGEDELAQLNFSELTLDHLHRVSSYFHEYIIFGGYPRVVLAPTPEKKEVLRDIAYSYVKKDIFDANVRHEDVFYKLMKVLADQAGELVNTAELSNTLSLSMTTVESYLLIMRKSFHVSLIRPFAKNIRYELTKMPKVYWEDSGLRNFLADNLQSYIKRSDRGKVLENATYRQLRNTHSAEDIHFWRTANGKEVDFVIDNAAYEVKANAASVRKKKYQLFLKTYPDKPLAVITLDKSSDAHDSLPIHNPWELPDAP